MINKNSITLKQLLFAMVNCDPVESVKTHICTNNNSFPERLRCHNTTAGSLFVDCTKYSEETLDRFVNRIFISNEDYPKLNIILEDENHDTKN